MLTGLTLEQAVEQIRQHTTRMAPVTLPLPDARGRLLARDILSPISQPPFDRAPVDGYAVIAADTIGASQAQPVCLTVVNTVFAGGCPKAPLSRGQAVRIMTGAMLPEGCDSVIRQESTDMGLETVKIFQPAQAGENYVRAGEDFQAGSVLVSAGSRLDAAALAVLSSAGISMDRDSVTVHAMPRVAVVCTGDELVYPHVSPLPAGKIYDSNRTFVTQRLWELGIRGDTGADHFMDDPNLVAETIRSAMTWADAVLTTGGVSVGAKDIMHEVLPLLGAEQIFTRTQIKPGTPAIFSVADGKPILSLSGNPFAAAVNFELFARPMLAELAGDPGLDTRRTSGVLRGAFPKSSPGRRFIRAVYDSGTVTLPRGHSSGQMRSLIGCNCLLDIPGGSGPLTDGQRVDVVLL